MASTVVLELSASVVSATPIYGRATVWGSESIGANHTPPGFSWRKHYDEVTQQRSTAWFIANKFGLNGYDADDYQGDEGSYKNLILAQISDNEASYPRVAVIDFDHGVGRTDYGDYNPQVPEGEYHYLLEDNYGSYDGTDYDNKGAPHHEHIVYDMDIAYQTTMEKTFFALINTCMSANLANGEGPVPGTSRVQGMPYAWTHRYVRDKGLPSFDIAYDMSDDGYHKPDSGKFCYLGFEGGSAALSQTIACWPVSPYYHIWLEHFFAWALTSDITIKNALDESSQAWFDGRDFDETYLCNGFTASWPMFRNGDWDYSWGIGSGWGSLKVYGNANKKLYQPELTLSAKEGLSTTFTVNGQQCGAGGSVRVIGGEVYSINVNDIPGYQFDWFNYNGGYFGRPANIQITQDSAITAHFTAVPYIHILDSYGGYSEPYSGWYYGSGGRYITAHEYPENHFVEWKLNDDYLSSDPTVYVEYGTNTVQPIFAPDNPQYYSINVRGWEDVYSTEIYPNVYLNGNYYGTCEIYDTLQEGYYTFTADEYYDQFVAYYVIVTDSGQWMEWGNSVSLTLSSPTTIDFYYTGY